MKKVIRKMCLVAIIAIIGIGNLIPQEVDAATKSTMLSQSVLTLSKGANKDICLIVDAGISNIKSVTWKSTNAKICKVSAKGSKKTACRISGKGVGTATVSCTVKFKNGTSLKRSCCVTVKEKWVPILNETVKKGKDKITFKAYAHYKDNGKVTQTYIWMSKNGKVREYTTKKNSGNKNMWYYLKTYYKGKDKNAKVCDAFAEAEYVTRLEEEIIFYKKHSSLNQLIKDKQNNSLHAALSVLKEASTPSIKDFLLVNTKVLGTLDGMDGDINTIIDMYGVAIPDLIESWEVPLEIQYYKNSPKTYKWDEYNALYNAMK